MSHCKADAEILHMQHVSPPGMTQGLSEPCTATSLACKFSIEVERLVEQVVVSAALCHVSCRFAGYDYSISRRTYRSKCARACTR